MSVQRYEPETTVGMFDGMDKDSRGEWVKHSDHTEALDARDATIKELREELETSNADRRAVVREYVRGLNHLADNNDALRKENGELEANLRLWGDQHREKDERIAQLKEDLENAALEQLAEQARMEDRDE